ncbi:Vascular endothelial growth factor receptor 1 [Armadillidium nasatum]|uniref:Vascular endothelial growth factor receptor 1 n=1 Tax=Armadillidium nasatum TaxID=96803 RepID=A0A5N5SJI7_9CRUS|nr:Vascular endothelial growth factor receptor 1 [Armadillidium nasatum]
MNFAKLKMKYDYLVIVLFISFIVIVDIEEPIKEDTGYFNCSYVGENDVASKSTYVYMYGSESSYNMGQVDSLWIICTLRLLKLDIGDPIILDCRTTRPDIKVSVFKKDIEDVTDEFTLDYRRWFTKPAVSLQETGIYSCKEKKFGGEKTFLVNIQPQKKLQKPSIENHRNSFYVVGEEFALNCSIPVDKKENPNFDWVIPNENANKHFMRFSDKNYAISSLIIKNPSLSDSGNYTCIVEQGDSSVSDIKNIEVKKSIVPFVQFQVKNDTKQHILFVKEGDNFQWVMYFEGYPKNLKHTFYNPYRNALLQKDKRNSLKCYGNQRNHFFLKHSTNLFYVHIYSIIFMVLVKDIIIFLLAFLFQVSTSYVYEDGKLSLSIKRVTAEDFGNYSVKLEAPNGSYDENYAILIVNATPKVEFGNTPSLLPAGKGISITAFILAFTINKHQPNVIWRLYSDCPEGIGSCDKTNGTMLSHKLEKDTGPLNRYKSVVSLLPSTSGELLCEVRNDLGFNSTRMYLNVSDTILIDKTAPFLVKVRTEKGSINLTRLGTSKTIEVIEGDNIDLECSSLNFLFDKLTFNYSGNIFPCDTKLSSAWCSNTREHCLWKRWVIQICLLYTLIGGFSTQFINTEKMAPTVLPSSNVSTEGTEISVKSSDPFFIACYVEGRPKPTITWLKDGVNINEISEYFENKDRVFLKDNDQVLEFKFAQKEYEGKYECSIENRVGHIKPYANVVIEGAALSSMEIGIISAVVGFIVILCSVVIFLVIRVKKESKLRKDIRQTQLYLFEKGNVGDLNKECTIDEQAELLPYDHTYEVERENIKIGKQLGAGAFGRVMLAEVKGLDGRPSPTRVAVKMCKDGADMAHLRALTLELKIMIHLGKHLNIVNLIGAHTSNMDKGDLWILVEYCKYGNLLKFIQRAKAQFINQIDPVTGEIDIHRTFPFPNDPLSPTSLGRSSVGFGRTSNLDPDGYLETNPGGSMRSGRSVGRHPSTTSNTGSTLGASRPGMNKTPPQYQLVPKSGGEHYVMATELPTINQSTPRKESSISNPSSEMGYHMTLNTEMTLVSSPPPFSPTPSSTSGDFFFDSQGKPVIHDSGSIPGVSAPFTTTDLVCWAWQIANGMEYLTRRKVLHGDLAARNLLLADNNVVKISDFGLSRDMYKTDVYMKKGDEIMPIKWMAPEAIQQKVFSIQSDVWAYGITLWEMFTLGNTPYPGIPLNQEFTIALENGMRMEKPKYCNEEILLQNCWRLNPVERPSFSRIADLLSDMLSPDKTKNYVEMNTVYMQKNEEWMGRNEDYLNMVTSPDFKNLHSPMREEGVGLDPNYIPMTAVDESSLERGCTVEGGYLDMKSVTTETPETIFSPRPLPPETEEPNNVFTFSENERAFSEEQQSPAETSTLLEKPEGSPGRKSPLRNHNNNVNKLNGLNQQGHRQDQPLYQNLEKVTVGNQTKGFEPMVSDLGDSNNDQESKMNYVNILAV